MNHVQEEPIDTRIIKTQYKNYELLARYWNGRYRGRIWKNKVKVADYNGESIDLILESLVQIVDQVRQAQFDDRDDECLTLNDYVTAWHSALPNLEPGILAALKMLSRYKSHSAPLTRLRKISGYDNAQAVIQAIEKIDKILRDELLLECYEQPPRVNSLCTQPPYEVGGSHTNQVLVIDDIWAEALLQADYELSSRTA